MIVDDRRLLRMQRIETMYAILAYIKSRAVSGDALEVMLSDGRMKHSWNHLVGFHEVNNELSRRISVELADLLLTVWPNAPKT